MSNQRHYTYYVGDFETTIYVNQTNTEVWASALVQLGTEDVQILHSIDETWEYIKSLNQNMIIYYHNLKFDGEFWLSFFLTKLKLKQAFIKHNEEGTLGEWIDVEKMKRNTFKYCISETGQWYNIIVKVGDNIIEFRDSLKLLPFKVQQIGKSFKTKHQKLEMEYEGYRYAGCEITDKEKEYIANDVLVVKEAMEIMFQQGHNKLTIGSCCLAEYKKIIGKYDWNDWFPDLTKIELEGHKYPNADAWIRKSYKGGWCYVVEEKRNQVKRNGTTADVNSLYPSVMSSESGSKYPTGKPCFWTGNYIPDEALQDNKYYFIRVRTRFYLKENHLPFIQIKNSYLYHGNDCLRTSDVYDEETDKYYPQYRDKNGNICQAIPELVLTMTDFELLKDHYHLVDFEILDGCYFYAMTGLFDEYIEKYKKIKLESEGALRTLAKLFLNNLYGKLASSTDSSFKVAYVKEDGTIGYRYIVAHDKDAGFIAIGSAITSYARNFTIRTAQMNYYGTNKKGFIYADTDSIHCDLQPKELKGIKVDDKNFCCWKLESCWDEAIFVRQKTYIEHVTHENLEPIDKSYYNVKCAGMPDKCKNLFVYSMEQNYTEDDIKDLSEEELKFIKEKRDITDFKLGLTITGKLLPKRIQGGIVLTTTTYQMR